MTPIVSVLAELGVPADELEWLTRRASAGYKRAGRRLVNLLHWRLLPPSPKAPPKASRPRCRARTRAGGKCKAPLVWDRQRGTLRPRCRMHGGLSTGPRTAEGRQRCREAAVRRWARWRAAQDGANDHG